MENEPAWPFSWHSFRRRFPLAFFSFFFPPRPRLPPFAFLSGPSVRSRPVDPCAETSSAGTDAERDADADRAEGGGRREIPLAVKFRSRVTAGCREISVSASFWAVAFRRATRETAFPGRRFVENRQSLLLKGKISCWTESDRWRAKSDAR